MSLIQDILRDTLEAHIPPDLRKTLLNRFNATEVKIPQPQEKKWQMAHLDPICNIATILDDLGIISILGGQQRLEHFQIQAEPEHPWQPLEEFPHVYTRKLAPLEIIKLKDGPVTKADIGIMKNVDVKKQIRHSPLNFIRTAKVWPQMAV